MRLASPLPQSHLGERPPRGGSGAGEGGHSHPNGITQLELARAGIITEEMGYIAASRKSGRARRCWSSGGAPCRRRKLRRRDPGARHAGIRPLGSRARARHHPGQYQPRRIRADDHRPQLPHQDQRQYRQLGRHLLDRGGGGEAGLGDPLGRRHGDGPLHRPQHPQDPRMDHPQRAGADRHRADLPGAREGRRRSGEARPGSSIRTADRARRAGRRLFDHPCRRAPALHATSPPTASPASSRAAARSWRSGCSRITSENFLYEHFERHLRHHARATT